MSNAIFMGSPEFAVPALRATAQVCRLAGVVTQPDRPAGRGRLLTPSPVKTAALEMDVPVIQPEKLLRNQDALEQLRAWAPDVIVVAAYGKILRHDVLNIPPFGCINLHASLLPRWRGASPIQAAILHDDEFTGVTLMKMDEGLDTGPILTQQALRILAEDTAGSLEARLADLGARLLIEVLPEYLAGRVKPTPQPTDGDTYAPLLKKEDGRLDFSRSSELLARQVRACHPWPGSYLLVDGAPLKVQTAWAAEAASAPPGRMTVLDGYPAVGTATTDLVLQVVQPPGKKSMDGRAFLMGYRRWEHQVDR